MKLFSQQGTPVSGRCAADVLSARVSALQTPGQGLTHRSPFSL